MVVYRTTLTARSFPARYCLLTIEAVCSWRLGELGLAEGLTVYPVSGPSLSLEGESGILSNMQATAVTGSQKTKNLDSAVLVVVMCGLLTSFC